MKVLVTGGCGYIGSITSRELKDSGFEVVIYDSLENGYKNSVADFKVVEGDIKDKDKLRRVLREDRIEAVIHFAAYIEMGESMKDPYKFFENNFYGSQALFDSMVKEGVKKLVFSSTAGVYGNPESTPIKEESKKIPENPYGESKLMVENSLKWYDQIHALKYVALRYFNAAGASLDGKVGEAHQPESHLIPNIIKAVIEGREFKLFGGDYDTPDGTCVRDYIHVKDLARAHVMALEKLQEDGLSEVFNAGTGKGYSNKQVVEMVEKVSGKKVEMKIVDRRPGDADELVADVTKINEVLGFRTQHSDLETIVKTAWKWHTENPKGYGGK